MLQRADVRDELLLGDELVVFVGETVMLLSPLAGRLLALIDECAGEEAEIQERLFEEFGRPEDPEGSWAEIVGDLVQTGVLRSEVA